MTTLDFSTLLLMFCAGVVSFIGVCRTRLTNIRKTRLLWWIGYRALTAYGSLLLIYLMFLPYGPMSSPAVAVHSLIVWTLIAFCLRSRKKWHGEKDHAPPESNRAPLGEN
jgi:hypothetical protein